MPRHFRQFNSALPSPVGHVGSLGISLSPSSLSSSPPPHPFRPFSPRPPLWATHPHPPSRTRLVSPRLTPSAAWLASSKRGQSTERAEDDPHPSSPASLPRLLNIVSLRTLLRHTHPPAILARPPPSLRLHRHPAPSPLHPLSLSPSFHSPSGLPRPRSLPISLSSFAFLLPSFQPHLLHLPSSPLPASPLQRLVPTSATKHECPRIFIVTSRAASSRLPLSRPFFMRLLTISSNCTHPNAPRSSPFLGPFLPCAFEADVFRETEGCKKRKERKKEKKARGGRKKKNTE